MHFFAGHSILLRGILMYMISVARKSVHSRGSLLVEVVIGAAIILVLILSLSAAFTVYLKTALLDTHKIQATSLAEEGLEAMRFIRDSGWSNLTAFPVGSPVYLDFTGTSWVATTSVSKMYIDSVFVRTVTVDQVLRDSGNKIASSGTVDANTKKITVSVSWREGDATSTKTLATYLTNIF